MLPSSHVDLCENVLLMQIDHKKGQSLASGTFNSVLRLCQASVASCLMLLIDGKLLLMHF